jgi:hypothetical protein
VASDPEGNFVVAWQSSANILAVDRIRARRYDAAGNALGEEFHVATAAEDAAIASDRDGNVLVVWDKLRLDVEGFETSDVAARFFDASGNPAGEEFLVNTYTSGPQARADASSDSDGNFVVVWDSRDQDGDGWGVFGREFASDGTPLTSEFQINTHTTHWQYQSAVASDPAGDFVVVWESYDQDGHSWGIFGQRFAGPGLALTVDGTCPGPVIVDVSSAPPNTEVALIAAANTNGFTKGGALCPGTELEIGEPFQLPPRFVIVDGNGNGTTELILGTNRCHIQALALQSCETSNVVVVP